MNRYRINYTSYIEVEAETPEEAQEIAQKYQETSTNFDEEIMEHLEEVKVEKL